MSSLVQPVSSVEHCVALHYRMAAHADNTRFCRSYSRMGQAKGGCGRRSQQHGRERHVRGMWLWMSRRQLPLG